MRRLVAALAVTGLLTACSAQDRYELRFAAPITVATATGVQAMALDGDTLYYGEFDTGDVYRVDVRTPRTPRKVGHVDVRAKGANGLQSIAVYGGRVFVSWVRADRHLVVGPLDGPLTWTGPLVNSLRRDGHIAFTPNGILYVSIGHRVYDIDGAVSTVSDGWNNAFAFAVDARDRMFVADQPSKEGKAFVARGREKNHAKRRRFATGLAGTKPSGVAFVDDELLVCRGNVGDVARLHIGLDNVARRRESLARVKCRDAIVTTTDGSVITAIARRDTALPSGVMTTTLDEAAVAEHAKRVAEDGYTIVENAIDLDLIDAIARGPRAPRA